MNQPKFLTIFSAVLLMFLLDLRAQEEITAPCPKSPNCVSTLAEKESKRMEAISYSVPSNEIIKILEQVIGEMKRTEIVELTDHYMHLTFKTALFGFVDDVEFWVDDSKKVIHFRSASRVGYHDLGVNRNRMKKLSKLIREKLNQTSNKS